MSKSNAQESSMASTAEVSQEERDAYTMLARKSLENKISLTKKAISEDSAFATLAATSPGLIDYSKSENSIILLAQFAITSAFIHSWISTNTPLHFPNNVDLRFRADVWGIGLGGGVVWLSGLLAPAEELLGDVNFVLTTTVTHTEIAFSKDIRPVGALVGAGLNIQAGVFSGKGTFTRW